MGIKIMKPIINNGAKAREYMTEWMNLGAVGRFTKTDTHLICTARDKADGLLKTYRVAIESDSFGQCQFDVKDNFEDAKDWSTDWCLGIDHMTIDEKKFNAATKSATKKFNKEMKSK